MVQLLHARINQAMLRCTGFVVLCSLTWGLVGCQPAQVNVGPKEDAAISGKVTYKGAPVTDARISFESPAAGAFGTEFKDGAYSIPLGASGDFSVAITPVVPPMKMEASASGQTPKLEPRKDIPKKYQDAAKSGLKATFKPGEGNTYDVDMVD